MKKRFTAFLLVLSLLMGFAIPAQAASVIASEAFGENVIWTVYDDGTLEFSGTGDTKKLNDYTVGNYYRHNDILQRVVFTEGITGIGAYILYNSRPSLYDGIASIHIPSTTEKIGSYAFSGLQGLREVHISDLVRWCGIQFGDNPLDNGADLYLDGTLVEELVIPSEVTALSESSFDGCTSIKSVVIHGDVEQIGDRAFTSCTNLRSVLFLGDAPEIGEFTFALTEPTCYYPAGNATWTGDVMLDYGGTITWVPYTPGNEPVLPAPDVITGRCGDDLTWVLEDGVLTISGTGPMYDYDLSLKPNPWRDHAGDISSVVIGEGAESIGNFAFADCPNIARISIPDSVTAIGMQAFWNNSAMTELTLPKNMTVLSDYALYACKGLKTVTLSDSLTQIGKSAFTFSGIESLVIPAGVTRIGENALHACLSLKTVYFTGDAPEVYDTPVLSATNLVINSVGDVTAFYPADNDTWFEAARDRISTEAVWVPYDPASLSNPFTDVPESAYYFKPVMWAIENNITNGLTADTFGPNAVCNRAQVVTFLWRAAGSPEPETTSHSFVDVIPGSFCEKAVLWAVENKVTTGMDATHFEPNRDCDRAQVVTFLWRAAGSPEPENASHSFVDLNEGSFYIKPVLWAVENSITTGMDATHFSPNTSCSRAQVVTFLYRAYND